MPDPIYALSEADKRVVAAVVEVVQRRLLNVRPSAPVDDPPQNAESYVARVPDDGLPAMNDTGTGDEFPVPGWADCEIYRIRESDEDEYTVEPAPIDWSRRVFNLSETEIEGGNYILIHREKFNGRWIASSSAGGGSGGGGTVDTTDKEVVTSVFCSGGELVVVSEIVKVVT